MVPVVMSSTRMHKTYSSIPLFPFGCCRKCEPLSERPQPVCPLPPASGLTDSPLGAGKLKLQAGWSGTLGPWVHKGLSGC
jgi:hypothetical protein